MPHVVRLIRSSSLSDVAEYAYAATAPAGSRLIFLAGACPLNADGSTAAVGDYRGQAAKAFENMRTALADAGASVGDVLSTRVLVASSRQPDLVAAWQVIRELFGEHDAPSTLMGVTVLGYKDQLVEIEAVAAVLDSEGVTRLARAWRPGRPWRRRCRRSAPRGSRRRNRFRCR
jgi:enamine deaminase RidA (YjgF/YER057c/UK114 family)